MSTALTNMLHAPHQLKHSLTAVTRRTSSGDSSLPVAMSADAYVSCSKFLQLADAYTLATAAFSTLAAGRSTVTLVPETNSLHFAVAPAADKYAALDYLESIRPPGSTVFAIIMGWIYGTMDRPEVLDDIIKLARRDGKLIVYEYQDQLANKLREKLPIFECLIPENWNSAFGTAREVRDVLLALQTVAAYHAISVNIGAADADIVGLGLESIVLSIGFVELLRRISALVSDTAGLTERILTCLTFGNRTTTPDPALQPLVPFGEDRLLLAPLMFLTGRPERNFLVLLARYDPKAFDSASHTFEHEMIERIESVLRTSSKGWAFKCMFSIAQAREAGDIDVIVADARSKTLLIAELKWTLPPADPREWISRSAEAEKKVAQISRKRVAVLQHVRNILSDLKLSVEDSQKWTVCPVVVFDGFAAMPTNEVPVVTMSVFVEALKSRRNLKAVAKWLKSRDWLPRRNYDFFREVSTVYINGVELRWPSVKLNLELLQ